MADVYRDVKIRVDGKDFGKAGTQVSGFASKLKQAGSQVFSLRNAIQGVAGALMIRQGVKFFTGAIEALGKQEEAERTLQVAIQNTTGVRGADISAMKEYAAALQKVTTYGDEEILRAQSLLVSLGGLSQQALPAATKAMIDFAAAQGVDLQNAAMLFARAATGSTEALSRYGIKLKEGIPESQKFAALLEQVTQKFSGMAEAVAGTPSGKLKQLANEWGDMKEEIARTLVETGAFDNLMKSLREVMATFAGQLKDPQFLSRIFTMASQALQAVVKMLPPLINSLKWIVEHADIMLAVFGAIKGASLGGIFGPIGGLIGLVGGGIAGGAAGSYLKSGQSSTPQPQHSLELEKSVRMLGYETAQQSSHLDNIGRSGINAGAF